MYSWILNYVIGEEEVKADEKTLRQRHELMKQIKNSKLKLKKVKRIDNMEPAKKKKVKFRKKRAKC
jgi:hypothetical protein